MKISNIQPSTGKEVEVISVANPTKGFSTIFNETINASALPEQYACELQTVYRLRWGSKIALKDERSQRFAMEQVVGFTANRTIERLRHH